jgi:hypothetical protein
MPRTTFDDGWHAIYWKNGDFYCRFFRDGESYFCDPEDSTTQNHRGPTSQYTAQYIGFPDGDGPTVLKIPDKPF